MDAHGCNKELLNHIDFVLDLIVLTSGLVSLLGSFSKILVYKGVLLNYMVFCIGICLLITFFVRRGLSTRIKKLILVIFTYLVGGVSLLLNRFTGIGMMFFIINCICTTVLLTIIYLLLGMYKQKCDDNEKKLNKYVSKIYQLAYYDELSGLPNKHKLMEELSGRKNLQGWLVLFSVKEFELINSIYGIDIGNKVIVCISKVLCEISQNDFAARTAGNIFALYRQNLIHDELLSIIMKMTSRIRALLSASEGNPIIQFHCGYIRLDGKISFDEGYLKAQLALEQAKRNKKNDFIYYNEQIDYQFRKEEEMKTLLVNAFQNKEFYMCYQEKVSSSNNKTIGVEALARWQSPIIGRVSPVVFIPIIEKSNYSVQFDKFVITTVFDEYHKLCKIYKDDMEVSINISPVSLSSRDFPGFIVNAVKQRCIKPENIIIEITENLLMENIENISVSLDKLKRKGFRISLDDFGTGYSSLNYLSKLDIDELKIDKTFVERFCEDKKTRMIVQTIINLREISSFVVVAEGVENKEQCDSLRDMGCDVFQGFYFSKPTPLSELRSEKG